MNPVVPLLALIMVTTSLEAAAQSRTSPDPVPTVTFTKDIAPILQNRCQVCHRPNTFAPMPLVTYEHVRPWARAIRAQVLGRHMPPWFIEKDLGVQHFKDDRSLTDKEIGTILAWVDGGAVMGAPSDMPPPRTFPDDAQWQFGEPDLVVRLPQDYVVPAVGSDRFPSVLVDPKLTEDRYIAAVQIIASKGYRAVHHIRTALVPPNNEPIPGTQADRPLGVEQMGAFLNEYALGKGADVFPDGSGRLIKAGTKINVAFHVHPLGEETQVNIALGLKLHPKGYKPKRPVISMIVDNFDFDIRPNDPNARVDAYSLLTKPTRLLSWQPHMHNRGKAACIEAIVPLPNGNSRIQPINCARFTSNWHMNYVYDDDAAPLLPTGTVLHLINWYDNTSANKNNPDPDAQLTFGQRTIDEMSGTWLSLYEMTEAEFSEEVAAREAQKTTVRSSR